MAGTPIFNGRYTAGIQGDFAVFLIGMRINQLRAFRKWMPVASAMGPMLSTLYRQPDKGFLGSETFVAWRTILSVQYWRSAEDLERFARNPGDPHLDAWRNFNQAVGASGVVGIFHETYRVCVGNYESVYANMPRFGLANAAEHMTITAQRESMRQRIALKKEVVA
jgi:hypothetical protein